jgi:hypothetical protein
MDLVGEATGSRSSRFHGLSARLFPCMTTMLAVLAIGAVFWLGLQRGMDRVLTFGPQSEENAIAIAISELVYGVDGYLTHYKVLEALQEAVHRGTDGAHDPKLELNVRNGALINEGISAATSLGPLPLTQVFVADGGLRTMVYDDVGIVDFVKVAFATFGFRIESLYYLFFAALLLSTVAFALQFWSKPFAQILLVCTVSAFLIELQSQVFYLGMPTFWGMRHGSTLGLVPTLHLALLLAYRCKLNLAALGLASIQVAILVLAIKMRGSAVWAVILLGGLTVVLAYAAWRQADERSVSKLVRLVVRWPLLLVLAGMAINGLYTNSKLHPVYFTDDVLPYHGAWHSAFLGLNISPEFWPLTGVVDGAAATTDSLGYVAAVAYLKKQRFMRLESEYLSPWTSTYKMRLHDNIMRRVVLDLVVNHPTEAASLYLYWKPIQTLAIVQLVLKKISLETWLAVLLGAALLAGLLLICQPTAEPREFRMPFLIVLAAIPVSLIPNMWAYASLHTISDTLLVFYTFVAFGVCWGVTVVVQRWRSWTMQNTVA